MSLDSLSPCGMVYFYLYLVFISKYGPEIKIPMTIITSVKGHSMVLFNDSNDWCNTPTRNGRYQCPFRPIKIILLCDHTPMWLTDRPFTRVSPMRYCAQCHSYSMKQWVSKASKNGCTDFLPLGNLGWHLLVLWIHLAANDSACLEV